MEEEVFVPIEISSSNYKDLEVLMDIKKQDSYDEAIRDVLRKCPLSTRDHEVMLINFESFTSHKFLKGEEFKNFVSIHLRNFLTLNFKEIFYHIKFLRDEIVIDLKNTKECIDVVDRYFRELYELYNFPILLGEHNYGYVHRDVVDALEYWKNDGKKIYVYSTNYSAIIQKMVLSYTSEVILSRDEDKFTRALSKEVDGFLDVNNFGDFSSHKVFKSFCSKLEVEGKKVCVISRDAEEIKSSVTSGIDVSILDARETNSESEYLQVYSFKQFLMEKNDSIDIEIDNETDIELV